MTSIDVTEFVKESRKRLIDAIGKAGVPENQLRELCHKAAPFGSYKLPVIIFKRDKPVAKYFLSYPIKDGVKSVKFNIETFNEISQWLTQNPQPELQPSASSTTENQSSF